MAILAHLMKKETPFAIIDSHAGRGMYALGEGDAARTQEADGGILKLLAEANIPPELEAYAALMRDYAPARYPGSPMIALRLMRPKDRLIAIDKHPEEHTALAEVLRPSKRARAILGDGYRELLKLMPPPERRGLILIDPPYEATNEFEMAVAALIAAQRKFASGIFMLWYPAKARGAVDGAAGELLAAGITRLLRIELDVGRGPDDEGRALAATGLLVVNPPYGFQPEMEKILAYLVRALARGTGAKGNVRVLAGEA
jgi:23S rRNA (adenine2030-N6)-methyltransferase